MQRYKRAGMEILKDILFGAAYITIVTAIMALGILWYISPCDGFKEGVLYYGPAPARCME